MTGRRRSLLEQTGLEPTEPVDCYECSCCETTFGDWPEDCPECGQLVVRVVESRPEVGRWPVEQPNDSPGPWRR